MIGALSSFIAGIIAFLVGATRRQVQRVADAVIVGGVKQDAANTKLDTANHKLDAVVGVLREIRDRLPS